MNTKLHAILAVEPTRESAATRQINERVTTFNGKRELYTGETRTLVLFGKSEENRQEFTAIEAKDAIDRTVQTTVAADLNYMAGIVGQWLDVNLQKEIGNQLAKADLVVDDVVLIKDVPSIWLLGMETKLKKLREIYEAIPTLPPGIVWTLDPNVGKDIFVTPLTTDIKTSKTFDHKLLKQSSDKHPDTWEKIEILKNIGEYTNQKRSGMISVAAKAAVIARLDKLLMAIKVARQTANELELPSAQTCSDAIFGFLHGDMHDATAVKAAASGTA